MASASWVACSTWFVVGREARGEAHYPISVCLSMLPMHAVCSWAVQPAWRKVRRMNRTYDMNSSLRSLIAPAAVAFAALATTGVAAAHTDVYGSVYLGAPPPVYVAPARAVAVQPQVVYAGEWAGARPPVWSADSCRAARWTHEARYMPGDVVWRHGRMYVATRLSAHVWNVNSPPESTPNYWVPARCD
jgi:hypothetical protein